MGIIQNLLEKGFSAFYKKISFLPQSFSTKEFSAYEPDASGQIYEDRPTLCRTYPESPFSAIASCCGYYPEAQSCLNQIEALRQELATLKRQEALLEQKEPDPLNPA